MHLRPTVLFTAFLCSGIATTAQIPIHEFRSEIGLQQDSNSWIQFKPELKIDALKVFELYAEQMGLDSNDEMVLVNSKSDELGWEHHTFQQYHEGIPVEFALFKVHARNGLAVKGNGDVVRDLQIAPQIQMSEQDALEAALVCIGAASYNWQYPGLEALKQRITQDPKATFFPKGTLYITDADFDPGNPDSYHLAWKFEIHAHAPQGRHWIYVDAESGEILKDLNLDMHDEHPTGMAETRYSGLRQITTDTVVNGFVLRDMTRGQGVETYDAGDSSDMQYAIDFFDEDNYWDHHNERQDDAATDAHWAAAQLYDYLRDTFGLNSYDDQGSKMISFVHVRQNWRNARWNGLWSEYGDATTEPWTHINVVGHEIAHGITGKHSSMIYSRESGALNESFSDIIGEALEYYTGGGSPVDWLSLPSPVDTLRSLQDPKAYGDPDTYFGENWHTASSDNFGVHTNSGVQNHWFYLLVEGGSGVNDLGDTFNLTGIGMSSAMQILMRSALTYLMPNSGYFDARQGALFAAEDLFGACSPEYHAVGNAWYAVGVGDPIIDQDFTVVHIEPMDLCNRNAVVPATVFIKHLGCDSTGPISLDIKVRKTNPNRTITEEINLPEGIGPGAVVEYTLNTPLEFTKTGMSVITAEVTSVADLNAVNNISGEMSAFFLEPVADQRFAFHTNIAFRTFRDSLAFVTGQFADLDILPRIGMDSTYGIRIEGSDQRYAKVIAEGQDVFDVNARYGSQICACVDATNLDSLRLSFDLRQTFSSAFEDDIGLPQPPTNALRVLVDEVEMARYVPQSNNEDPWQNHEIELHEFVGTEFRVCFDARTIQSIEEDRDSIGDRIFLDNIAFSGLEVLSKTSDVRDNGILEIYPNPATGFTTVHLGQTQGSSGVLRVYRLDGKLVLHHQIQLHAGANHISLDLNTLIPGLYFLDLRSSTVLYTGRLVVR